MIQQHFPPRPLGHKHKNHKHEEHGHDQHGHSHEHVSTNSYTFDWLLDLLKKVLKVQPDENGILKGEFTCPEASYFNKKINECRGESGGTPVNEHEHNPEFTKKEQKYVAKKITKEIQRDAHPLDIVSQKPNEIIYGNASDPDTQIKYKFENNKWNIIPGRNVNAIIIDPAGNLIEIKPGPHIHKYGDWDNLNVVGACKDKQENHKHSNSNKEHHKHDDEHKHHNHQGPCSQACGHSAKLTECRHSHRHGHGCCSQVGR